jgi:hypothetical protein
MNKLALRQFLQFAAVGLSGTAVQYLSIQASVMLQASVWQQSSVVTGSANRFHAFGSTGVLATSGAVINGSAGDRLPGISSVTIPGALNETLLLLLDGEKISCSTGAACTAGVHRPSHVLEAMGLREDSVMSTLRFSFGATSSQSDVDTVIAALPAVVERARSAR